MANKTQTIRIESILGGMSDTDYYANADQFSFSLNIDPSVAVDSAGRPSNYGRPSGVMVPVISSYSASVINNAPLWMVPNPKDSLVYVYDYGGSVYSLSSLALTNRGDLNDGGSAQGNGAAYYDNYLYFSRSTTVARYGPLDGTPSFTDDYWSSTLGKTALTDTVYPVAQTTYVNIKLPNHILHRHSDGKLYIADVVGNTGTLHYIKTRKTTVEGDTDDGSTYDKIHVGYGLWPTAMETYGDQMVIALFEGQSSFINPGVPAKLAFWDTVSEKVNIITLSEFPDTIITALINVGGVLYIVSGTPTNTGFRLSRYVGGYSFEEVALFGNGYIPMAGAVYADAGRLFFGGRDTNAGACTYMYGLRSKKMGNGIFPLGTNSVVNGAITAVSPWPTTSQGYGLGVHPAYGLTDTFTPNYKIGANYVNSGTVDVFARWQSQTYKIGRRFKITRIRIPFGGNLPSAVPFTVRVLTDNQENTFTLMQDLSGYVGKNVASIQPNINVTGENDFNLFLQFDDASFVVVFPITIEYEIYDD